MARDRVGKKPLYYYHNGQTFAFASELKALRVGDLCPDELDLEALDCYFSFGYIPAPKSIYKAVKKLPASRYLRVSKQACTEIRYWNLSFADPIPRTLDEVTEEFAALLDEAGRCRLMSEVPLGVFLSGGLDSTLVAASMARLMTVSYTHLDVYKRQVVPSESVEALTTVLLEAVNNPQKRQMFARAGQQRFEEYFTFDEMITAYQKIYRDLLSPVALGKNSGN